MARMHARARRAAGRSRSDLRHRIDLNATAYTAYYGRGVDVYWMYFVY